MQRDPPLAESRHFTLYRLHTDADTNFVEPGDMVVIHHFAPHQIDNDIGYYVANELLPLLLEKGCLQPANSTQSYGEQELFERYVGAIVRSMDAHEGRAWQRFYDNTLQALQQAPVTDTALVGAYGASTTAKEATAGPDFIANFAAIYRCAMTLVDESIDSTETATVLDVATCFGFFPLLLASASLKPKIIIGCDLNPALVKLANDYARSQQLNQVRFSVEDMLTPHGTSVRTSVATPSSFQVVTALHFLEHLETHQTPSVLARLWDLTEQRLIIAVPLEETPDSRFGHQQVFNRQRLLDMGQALGGAQCHYYEYYGGWLVADRMATLNDTAIQ
jgi:2-polyprenyl-3-methyl-5-hydroxy-6-metoxy-1,4-benzoquinol methylase